MTVKLQPPPLILPGGSHCTDGLMTEQNLPAPELTSRLNRYGGSMSIAEDRQQLVSILPSSTESIQNSPVTHQSSSQLTMLYPSNAYTLTVRQEPERAKAFSSSKEKDRKPIDPPPIVQLQITDPSDPAQNYLQSPYFFMCCSLVDADLNRPGQIGAGRLGDDPGTSSESALVGVLVSSLHRLKDTNNTDGGFFVFPDISVKLEGTFRLRFSLFEMIKEPHQKVVYIKSATSNAFPVYNSRNFPGMLESTFLSRSFSDQGVRLRVRKEPRVLGKRPAGSDLGSSQTESGSRSISGQESPGTSHTPQAQANIYSSGIRPSPLGPAPNVAAQGDPYNQYSPRDPTAAARSSMYGQGPQVASGFPQDYAFASRSDQPGSANTAQPGGGNWLSSFPPQSRVSGMQYPYRETDPQYQQSTTPTRASGVFPQPLSSSPASAGQYDYGRAYGSYTPGFDDRRVPTLSSSANYAYPTTTSEQTPGSSAATGYANPQTYPYGQYGGQQGYR